MFTFCIYNLSVESPSSLFILGRHYKHIFAVFYPFHKINSSRHNNIMAFEIRITMLIHNKDDIEFVTEFPCFLVHPAVSWKTILSFIFWGHTCVNFLCMRNRKMYLKLCWAVNESFSARWGFSLNNINQRDSPAAILKQTYK